MAEDLTEQYLADNFEDVRSGILKNLEIPVPDINIQEKFILIKSIADKQKDRLQQTSDILEELFKSLIYIAFNPKDEFDEIQALINDDVQIELLLNTISASDFKNLEQYSEQVDKLFQILDRTIVEERNFISSEEEPISGSGNFSKIQTSK